jgi:hypothetical protein
MPDGLISPITANNGSKGEQELFRHSCGYCNSICYSYTKYETYFCNKICEKAMRRRIENKKGDDR